MAAMVYACTTRASFQQLHASLAKVRAMRGFDAALFRQI
jgi:hypothetical protein